MLLKLLHLMTAINGVAAAYLFSVDNLVSGIISGPDATMVPHNTTMPNGTIETVWVHEAFTPVAGPVNSDGLTRRLKWNPKGQPNQCGNSTFVDRTTSNSPAQPDCQVVLNQMINGPGYWQLWQGTDLHSNGDWCRVAYHESCVFGVKTTVVSGMFIGTDDIIDLTKESMRERAGDPRVQFEGRMNCNNPMGQGGISGKGDRSPTDWAIFKPL